MDYKKMPAEITKHMRQVKILISRELPKLIGDQAVEHFKDNFRLGGFVDGGLNPWKDVKRRNPASGWYGFEYKGDKRTYYAFSRDKKSGKTYKAAKQKRLNFSEAATRRTVLTSKRNVLMNSLRHSVRGGAAVVSTNATHAQLHNEGGTFKVFGKAAATMPQRQFMGHSKELDQKIEHEIMTQIDRIFQ